MQAFDSWTRDLKTPLGKRMVDVGAQDTHLKEAFEQRGFEWNAIDPAPCSELVCRARMEHIPSEDNTFDLVFSCHSFEHCEHPIEALREMRRVCKVGGWIFLATPFPCEHQILQADSDHIFVLTPMQMIRLLEYTHWSDSYSFIWDAVKEQDKTIVSVARKKLLGIPI